jgi:hypothetical protein
MRPECSSEMLILVYQVTRCHIAPVMKWIVEVEFARFWMEVSVLVRPRFPWCVNPHTRCLRKWSVPHQIWTPLRREKTWPGTKLQFSSPSQSPTDGAPSALGRSKRKHRETISKSKNAVCWDIAPHGSCQNRRFRGTYRLHHQDKKNQCVRNISSN